MLSLTLERRRGRNPFGSRSVAIREGVLSGPIDLAPFLDLLLERWGQWLPFLHLRISDPPLTLVNLRGRPSETFASGRPSRREELFHAAGWIEEVEPLTPQVEGATEVTHIPFLVSVESQFHSFPDHRNITHDTVCTASPILMERIPELTPIMTARIIPVILRELRVGVEFFQGRFLGALSGAPPFVVARFFFQLAGDEMRFEVQWDSRQRHPFPLVQVLDETLAEFGLYRGLMAQLLSE